MPNHWTVRQKPRTVFPLYRFHNSGSSWIPCVTIQSSRKHFRNPNNGIHKLAWALHMGKLNHLDIKMVLPKFILSQSRKLSREFANSHQKPQDSRMDQYIRVTCVCQSARHFNVIFSNREWRCHASVVLCQKGHTIGLSRLLLGFDSPLECDEAPLRPASTVFGLRRYSPSARSL